MFLSLMKSTIFIIDIYFDSFSVYPQPPRVGPSHPPLIATNNSVIPLTSRGGGEKRGYEDSPSTL